MHERWHLLVVESHWHAPPGQSVCEYDEQAAPHLGAEPAGLGSGTQTQSLFSEQVVTEPYLYSHGVVHLVPSQLQVWLPSVWELWQSVAVLCSSQD